MFDPITSWEIDGEIMRVMNFIFLGSKITEDWDCSHQIKRHLFMGKKSIPPRQCVKEQRHHFGDKGCQTQSYGFPSSHLWMSELDHKEAWALKNWCFWTVVLDKTHESPLDSKEIKPVNPKGNQLWIFIGRSDIEAEAPIFWPPDVRSQLTGKDIDGEKIEGRRRRRWQRMRWLDAITESMDMSWANSGR